jgi:hypothetical protein
LERLDTQVDDLDEYDHNDQWEEDKEEQEEEQTKAVGDVQRCWYIHTQYVVRYSWSMVVVDHI